MRLAFPLVYHPRYAANFLYGEKLSKDEIRTYLQERYRYTKLVEAYNNRRLLKDRELDLSFCKLPPLDYQELPILIGLASRHAFFHLDTGLGKTYVAGYIAIRRLLTGKARRCLIVCPKVAVQQWQEELVRFFDFPEEWIDERIIVINYEGLYDHLALRNLPEGGKADPASILAVVPADLVILDESHLIKNPRSVRAAVVSAVCRQAKYRIAMTGTPVRNQPLDLFFQLSLINPWAFRIPFSRFLQTFFVKIETSRFVKYQVRVQKLPIITEIAEKNMLKLSKQELPEYQELKVTHEVKAVNPTAVQMNYAAQVATEVLKLGDSVVELKNQLMKLQQISSGFLQYRHGDDTFVERFASPKLDEAVAAIASFVKQDEKVVVFAKFHVTIDTLLKKLHSLGIAARPLTGKLNDRQVEAIKREFVEGSLPVLIIQLQKGEHSLNLQVARYVVFVEYDWTPASIEQAIGRVCRKGQERDVIVKFFVTKGLIDEEILRLVRSKAKITAKALRQVTSKVLANLR